ncbi:DUF6484 domain-containing protein [Caballeronia glebae]|jgi:hypothetical protein|uniref:DUF6484 domain-containing protein n=1 Tax=Caballeronia glebae TaxID=1777143 RepID=UPI0038BCAF7C
MSATQPAIDPPCTDASPVTAPANATVIMGCLIGFREGHPLVSWKHGALGADAVEASTIVDLHDAHVGRQVALSFELGLAGRPVILGCVRDEAFDDAQARAARRGFEAICDGERLIISARSRITLRCGAASITLTAAGKVLLQGEYVSSSSTGVNRLTGGSVEIN